jgi:hypothetical protein
MFQRLLRAETEKVTLILSSHTVTDLFYSTVQELSLHESYSLEVFLSQPGAKMGKVLDLSGI